MSLHTHFHIAICVDSVKKFNGTEHPFAEWDFSGEPPKQKFPRVPLPV